MKVNLVVRTDQRRLSRWAILVAVSLLFSSFLITATNVPQAFAETFFANGFEDGDGYSSWTVANNPSITHAQVHHGVNASSMDAQNERADRSFTLGSARHVRVYVKWTQNPSSGGFFSLFTLQRFPGTDRLVAEVYNDNGVVKWRLSTFKNDSTWDFKYFSTMNPTTNTWYSVEMKWTQKTEHGAHMWINGVYLGNNSGTTHDSGVGLLRLNPFGLPITGIVYYDCVMIADSYIGEEIDRYYLNVTSLHDEPTPTSGWFNAGANITASVTSPALGPPGARHVCTGWTGEGDVPPSGIESTVNFTITQNSSITWNWKVQHLLTMHTDPSLIDPQPTLDPSGEPESSSSWWYNESSAVTLTAQAAVGYNFDRWTVNGASQGDDIYQIILTMDEPQTAIAYYSLSDVTPPEITILSPLNVTYYASLIPLEYTANEETSWTGYSLDGQENVTVGGNATLTVTEGSHSVIVYANDTFSNMGFSDVVYFTALTGVIDIAVAQIRLSKTVVWQNYSMLINVTVENQGDYAESFEVVLNVGAIEIEKRLITLDPRENATLEVTWIATDFPKGNHTVRASVDTVVGETDTLDNTLLDGWIVVSMIGDVTGPDGWPDGKCDIRDIALVARYFGQNVPPAPANCDVTGSTPGVPDGKIDIRDIAVMARDFGKTDP